MTITSPEPRRFTQRQLESALWSAANALRGPVEPADFKSYVFPVLFFKWCSDMWDFQHAKAVAEWGDELDDEIEADYHEFVLPKGCHWTDIQNTAVNVGAKLGTTLQRIEQANPKKLAGVFGDVQWANKERLPEERLAALLDAFRPLKLDPEHIEGDMLGAAYEYLLKQFADNSGKKAGEFFTPRHVVRLFVGILQPRPGEDVGDPACGSGGMLIETVATVRAAGGDPRTLHLFGQDANVTTSAIAKMNLYLHGIEDFVIRQGDTFGEPRLLESDARLRQFDITIANPPFSLSSWGEKDWARDPYKRSRFGVPPAKNGDYAWIEHMLTTMKPGTGRVGVVMPHGVLFRGGKEKTIRRAILEADLLEAVIGLAPNLFYSTTIPVCLLIFRASKSAKRKGKVLYVDASELYVSGKNQNSLADVDVAAITAAYRSGDDHDGDNRLNVRLVDLNEIRANHHDLNIGLYIAGSIVEEVDVDAALAAWREAREQLTVAEAMLDAKLKVAGFDA